MTPAEIYASCALAEIPRIIGMIDRRPLSPTEGSADRTHWQWKFTDFAGARFQECAWTLAYAYTLDHPSNRYKGQPHILRCCERAIDFWTTCAHSNGAFDEAYPGENSFVATAFTSLAISSATILLGDALDPSVRTRALATLANAGGFLIRTDETHAFISNHRAGAAAALLSIEKLCGGGGFERRANELLESIFGEQSSEGWYREYSGADPGYHTQGIFYMSLCYKLKPSGKLLDSLTRAMRYEEDFVYPDGTVGGEVGSRNTEFVFAGGFELMTSDIPESAAIAERIRKGFESGKACGPQAMDPYNIMPVTNSCFVAAEACRTEKSCEKRSNGYGVRTYPKSGCVVVRTKRYHAVFATKKGGALRIVGENGSVVDEPGYSAILSSGKRVSSQGPSQTEIADIKGLPAVIEISNEFHETVSERMTTWKLFLLRLGAVFIGGAFSFSRFLKSILVKKLTRLGDPVGIRLKRFTTFDEDHVSVHDEITWNEKPVRLIRGGPIGSIHMGSSMYFEEWKAGDVVTELKLDGVEQVIVDRDVAFDSPIAK